MRETRFEQLETEEKKEEEATYETPEKLEQALLAILRGKSGREVSF